MCVMDGDEEEGVEGVVDGDLSLIVGNREMDAVSGEVKRLCALCILVQLPLALRHQITDGSTEHSISCRTTWEVQDHGRD